MAAQIIDKGDVFGPASLRCGSLHFMLRILHDGGQEVRAFARRKTPSKPHGHPGSWDYRVVRFVEKSKRKGQSTVYRICEVHFDKDGFVHLWTDATAEGKDMRALAQDVRYFNEALEQPVIDFREFRDFIPPPPEDFIPADEFLRQLREAREGS